MTAKESAPIHTTSTRKFSLPLLNLRNTHPHSNLECRLGAAAEILPGTDGASPSSATLWVVFEPMSQHGQTVVCAGAVCVCVYLRLGGLIHTDEDINSNAENYDN